MGPEEDSAVVPEDEEFSRSADAMVSTPLLWMAPLGDTNADAALLLLPIDAAAAANVENRMLADAAVANEKTTGDKKRIWEREDDSINN